MLKADAILAAYAQEDPSASGNLLVKMEKDRVTVSGELTTTHPKPEHLFIRVVQELAPKASVTFTWQVNKRRNLAVVVEGEAREAAHLLAPETLLDQVGVLYMGELPLDLIKESPTFKQENWDTIRKVEACVEVVGFIAPLVLDKTLTVVDGNMRLTIARNLLKNKATTKTTVPVIVVDDSGVKSDFLRLVLNRSSEFQRWFYDRVDAYLDTHPQTQPLLEPLGFFGERILPVSFFGNTVMAYSIDPYNKQQLMYKQEIGLATWAGLQRERLAQEKAAKQARRAKAPTPTTVSLFDLHPTEDDFMPTYDGSAELEKTVEENKELAEVITNNYDAVRKAEKEAKGQPWQTTRRSSKQVAADARARAEERKDEQDATQE